MAKKLPSYPPEFRRRFREGSIAPCFHTKGRPCKRERLYGRGNYTIRLREHHVQRQLVASRRVSLVEEAK
jgi:hypothetical protein